jgi:hypothetical protein
MAAAIAFVLDDGGRAAAGYKGATNDCAVRAIAIATGLPYAMIYAGICAYARRERPRRRCERSHPRTGVWPGTVRWLLVALGWQWTPARVHLRADELPSGPVICRIAEHYCAVVDGVLHDTQDWSSNGQRAVYGYWTRKTG